MSARRILSLDMRDPALFVCEGALIACNRALPFPLGRVQMSALLQLTTGLLGGSLHDHNVVTRFNTEA